MKAFWPLPPDSLFLKVLIYSTSGQKDAVPQSFPPCPSEQCSPKHNFSNHFLSPCSYTKSWYILLTVLGGYLAMGKRLDLFTHHQNHPYHCTCHFRPVMLVYCGFCPNALSLAKYFYSCMHCYFQMSFYVSSLCISFWVSAMMLSHDLKWLLSMVALFSWLPFTNQLFNPLREGSFPVHSLNSSSGPLVPYSHISRSLQHIPP